MHARHMDEEMNGLHASVACAGLGESIVPPLLTRVGVSIKEGAFSRGGALVHARHPWHPSSWRDIRQRGADPDVLLLLSDL